MAIQSIDNLYAAFSAGQTDRQDWNKITGAAAYAAGRWYETFSLGGYPPPTTYPGTALAWKTCDDATGDGTTRFGIPHGGNVSTLAFDMKDMGYVIGYIGGKTSLSGVGGFVGALCGIYLKINSPLHPVGCVLVAAAVGGVIMLIPALLKVKLGASEMVTSLMLNYIIMFVVLHFLNYNFADRTKGSTQTYPILDTARIPEIIANGTKLTWGFVIAIIFVVLVALFMYRTKWGYAIRMIGINQSFAKYSGMQVGAMIVLSQVIGGVLSGMGGSIEVLGRFNSFLWKELPGYGWAGITIAILAKNNPIFVPFAAFFIAYLNKGCQQMATYSDVPSEMIDIIQAAIFLFFAAEQFLAKYRQKIVVKNTQMDLANQAKAAANAEGGSH